MRRTWFAGRSVSVCLGRTLLHTLNTHRLITTESKCPKQNLDETQNDPLSRKQLSPLPSAFLGTCPMSGCPSAWWKFTTEQSIQLSLEYMRFKACAVLSSSLSVRALGEMGSTKDTQAKEPVDPYLYSGMKWKPASTHPVCFVKDEMHPKYPVCMIDVHDIKQVELFLWWLQRTQPKAIQLHGIEGLSGKQLRQVLDVLFSAEPVLSTCVPLYTNLSEFTIDAEKKYRCTKVLNALEKCTSLSKLNLSKCRSIEVIKGLEKLVLLEELDLSDTNIRSLTAMRNCRRLTHFHTLKLRQCKFLKTVAGVEGLANLKHIDLTESSVTSLAGLEHCTSLRTIILNHCYCSEGAPNLKNLRHLEAVDFSYANVDDISFLSRCENLRALKLSEASVEDVTPLQSCKALRELDLSECRSVNNIGALRGLVNLEKLDLQWTSVSNIEPLSGCISLRVLDLSHSKVQSIAAVQNMSKLEELRLSYTSVADLSPLVGCLELKILTLKGCGAVRSLVPLAGMKKLEHLNLEHTSVSNLTPLAGCREMRYLSLRDCNDVPSVLPLADMNKLEILDLYSTFVLDLTPLAGCLKLRRLDVSYCNEVRDLRVLEKMPQLEEVLISSYMKNNNNVTDGLSYKTNSCINAYR